MSDQRLLVPRDASTARAFAAGLLDERDAFDVVEFSLPHKLELMRHLAADLPALHPADARRGQLVPASAVPAFIDLLLDLRRTSTHAPFVTTLDTALALLARARAARYPVWLFR